MAPRIAVIHVDGSLAIQATPKGGGEAVMLAIQSVVGGHVEPIHGLPVGLLAWVDEVVFHHGLPLNPHASWLLGELGMAAHPVVFGPLVITGSHHMDAAALTESQISIVHAAHAATAAEFRRRRTALDAASM